MKATLAVVPPTVSTEHVVFRGTGYQPNKHPSIQILDSANVVVETMQSLALDSTGAFEAGANQLHPAGSYTAKSYVDPKRILATVSFTIS